MKARNNILYITLLVSLIFIFLPLVLVYGKYNELMLWSLPFGIGMCFVLLLSLLQKPSLLKIIYRSFFVLIAISISSIFIGGEGFICFLIMGLFILIPFYMGIIVGHIIQDEIWLKNTLLILVITTTITSATIENSYKNNILVKDEIILNISSEALWEKLIKPVHFGQSSNFFFSNGVSYPNYMHIDTSKSTKYLYCKYNGGEIFAPIIAFGGRGYFAFTFSDSIATMQEKNFYNQSKTMHLKNHFLINYGKFEIIKIDSNTCKLIASTSFQHKFEPAFYTNFWVKYFTHQVHQHVLNNFKNN